MKVEQNAPQSLNLSISQSLRADLQAIADFIPRGARVLDLGCGNGELLEFLIQEKGIKGRGIELSEAGVMACVSKGLSVRQGNLNEGLADYPNRSFEYVILSQTLPFLSDPAKILHEMLRVGQNAIVSFPNCGYWRSRLELLFTGCVPRMRDLPRQWYDPPRMQLISVTDFAHYCTKLGMKIDKQVYLANGRRVRVGRFKNLLSTTAVFTLVEAA